MKRSGLCNALVAALILGCARSSISPTDPVNQVIATAKFDPSLHVDLAKSVRMPTGLFYRDILVGDGPVAAPGQHVSVVYTGWLVNGKQFDSNQYDFPLGTGAVVPGWDLGIAGMHVGGRRQLVIPGALGYGAAGSGPIPPNAIMVFTVELVSAK